LTWTNASREASLTKLKPFPKHTYGSLNDLLSDISAVLSNHKHLRKALRGNLVSAAFRERLMLVVTQVNDCRYCSSFHTAEAIRVGISADEIDLLKGGSIPDDLPPFEHTAIRYARHWAEFSAEPAEAELSRLVEFYGQETADAIQILLRMIRIGNLSGNTWDSWLYRLSSGRWGLPQT
jgi:AhpD family alkylhydroperoxidase